MASFSKVPQYLFTYLALLLSFPFAGLALPCLLVSISGVFDAWKHLGYASWATPEYVATQYSGLGHAVCGVVLAVAGLWAFCVLLQYAKRRSSSIRVLAALSIYVVAGVATPSFAQSTHWGFLRVNPELFLFSWFPLLIAALAAIALLFGLAPLMARKSIAS